jgi:hypothetical protein
MEKREINFGAIKLPTGYTVEWGENDEMYHWVNGDRSSIAFCYRFDALRAAWVDAEEKHAESIKFLKAHGGSCGWCENMPTGMPDKLLDACIDNFVESIEYDDGSDGKWILMNYSDSR